MLKTIWIDFVGGILVQYPAWLLGGIAGLVYKALAIIAPIYAGNIIYHAQPYRYGKWRLILAVLASLYLAAVTVNSLDWAAKELFNSGL